MGATIAFSVDTIIPERRRLISNPNQELPASPFAYLSDENDRLVRECELGGAWVSHIEPSNKDIQLMTFSVCLAEGVNTLVIEGLPRSTTLHSDRGNVILGEDREGMSQLRFSR